MSEVLISGLLVEAGALIIGVSCFYLYDFPAQNTTMIVVDASHFCPEL
jgi:hypothetical protein